MASRSRAAAADQASAFAGGAFAEAMTDRALASTATRLQRITCSPDRASAPRSGQRGEFIDQSLDDREPTLPECRVARVKPEGLKQLAMMLGAACRQHGQIALYKPIGGALIDGIEGVHQAIAERIRIDVERGVHEMGDIAPERLISGFELDRRTETLGLDIKPDLPEPFGGEFAIAAFQVHLAFKSIEGDLAH